MTFTQAGLQCGFGPLLGGETLAAVKAHGFTIVRLDCQDLGQDATRESAQEVIDAGLQPLCTLRRVEQLAMLPQGALAEAGNEPDIKRFGWTKDTYRSFVVRFVAEAMQLGIRSYVGAYSAGGWRERKDWVRDLPWHDIPEAIGCSMHWYPGKPDDRKQLRPTDAEIEWLAYTVGARPLAISEANYNDGPGGWTEEQVAAFMADLRRIFARHGFDFVVGFQLNDGPSADRDDHYGFRRLDGSFKPVAAAFTGAL